MKIKRKKNFLGTGNMFLGADENDLLGVTGWRVANVLNYSDFDQNFFHKVKTTAFKQDM
jgi:hypothetical protein